mmetsp:Transcript_27342/g.26405  ORF Transcript_27342/g.26405 Transcript_27342/m.26405 type:complete len:82 (+) Transcript_27342:437-682(+)
MWRSVMIKECDSSQQSNAHQSSGKYSSKAQLEDANQSGTPQISQESTKNKDSDKKIANVKEGFSKREVVYSEGGMWKEEDK